MNVRPRHPGTPATLIFLTRPVHAQLAADRERPLQLGRHLVIDGRFKAVPVEGHHKDHQHGNHQQHDAANPAESFSRSCHIGSLNTVICQ